MFYIRIIICFFFSLNFVSHMHTYFCCYFSSFFLRLLFFFACCQHSFESTKLYLLFNLNRTCILMGLKHSLVNTTIYMKLFALQFFSSLSTVSSSLLLSISFSFLLSLFSFFLSFLWSIYSIQMFSWSYKFSSRKKMTSNKNNRLILFPVHFYICNVNHISSLRFFFFNKMCRLRHNKWISIQLNFVELIIIICILRKDNTKIRKKERLNEIKR